MDEPLRRPDVGPPLTFPAGHHHWTLGVHRASIAEFFAPTADRGAILAERAHWLAEDPGRYVQWLPDAARPFEETLELLGLSVAGDSPYDRLLALGRTCEHDLVWLRPSGTGTWIVVGGVLCFPSDWALGDKLGRPLVDVHGPVPQLNGVLAGRIDVFLSEFDGRFGWRRFNWGVARDAERNHHPARGLPKLDAATEPDATFVRWEHQLLVRLPRSDAVLFALRIESIPMAEVKASPEAAGRLATLLETMPPDIAQYKRVTTLAPRLIAYLRG